MLNCCKFWCSTQCAGIKTWRVGRWSVKVEFTCCINTVYGRTCLKIFWTIYNEVQKWKYVLEWNRQKPLIYFKQTSTHTPRFRTCCTSDNFVVQSKYLSTVGRMASRKYSILYYRVTTWKMVFRVFMLPIQNADPTTRRAPLNL